MQRIGIDARFLLSNPRSAHAALLWELLSYNVVHPLPSVFVLYTNTRLHEIGSLAANNVRICYVPDRPGISDFFWLNSRLPAQLKRDSIDTYVSCFYKIPLRCCATTINMIHDTAFFDVCPERLIGKHRSRYYRLALLLSLRLHCGRASRVITVSNYSRDRIAKHLHLSRSKMAVCYNAVSRGFYAPQGEPNVRLELPKDYCLFVGSAQAKKNMDGMLRAFSMLPEILRRRFPLVLRSTPGADIIAIIDHLGLSENVIIMRDHLDEAHHCALVRSAAVVVLLSFDEGFGLPVAEAMAAGVPVLTSSGGALPEITNHLGGDHSPDSLSDISRAWELILVDSLRREEVIAAGKELSQRYHPDVVAPHFFELILTA